MTKVFLDTNILIYAVDKRDPVKHDRAIEAVEQCIGDGSGVISTQVLQEFASVALASSTRGSMLSWPNYRRWNRWRSCNSRPR